MRKPYYYRPDEHYDLGELGEHEIVFTAWIEPGEPEYKASITIVQAVVYVALGDTVQELDITKSIQKYPLTLEGWENEIRIDYMQKIEKEWGGDVA